MTVNALVYAMRTKPKMQTKISVSPRKEDSATACRCTSGLRHAVSMIVAIGGAFMESNRIDIHKRYAREAPYKSNEFILGSALSALITVSLI